MDARTLVIATSNVGKVAEIRRVLGDRFDRYLTLAEAGLAAPEETGATYAANARLKAIAGRTATGLATLADDSGLEVSALGGRPGVASARYGADSDIRIDRLLGELSGCTDRRARFVCVVSVALPGGPVRSFRGEVAGQILHERRGRGGFGFDPVFLVRSAGRSMAELAGEEKDRISHRGRALARLVRWLDALQGGSRP